MNNLILCLRHFLCDELTDRAVEILEHPNVIRTTARTATLWVARRLEENLTRRLEDLFVRHCLSYPMLGPPS